MGKKKKKNRKIHRTTTIDNPVYTAYFDGSCGPRNPGGTASYGAIIFQGNDHVWQCSEVYDPQPGREHQTSNNLAEYCGLIAVLEQFIKMGAQHEPIMVFGDSNLVIQQMFGNRKIKEGIYVPFAEKALELRDEFSNLGGRWIPRDENTIADELSKAHVQETGVDFRF